MEIANYLEILKGHTLESTTCNIIDEQVMVEKPKQIEISIFRSAERQEDKFEIEITIAGDYVYTISRYKTLEEAKVKYEELLRAIKTGEKKIKINMAGHVSVSIC